MATATNVPSQPGAMSQEARLREAGQRLSDAAFAGNLQLLEQLLQSGIHVDSPDNDGFTALHRSCVTGKVDIIRYLLTKGASVNIEDTYGDSPLHYACFCGHYEAVKALLAGGADPHRPSKDGKTPTESAAEERHWLVVDLIKRTVGPDRIPPIPSEIEQAINAGTYTPAGMNYGTQSATDGITPNAPNAPSFSAPLAPSSPSFKAPAPPSNPPNANAPAAKTGGFFSRLLGSNNATASTPDASANRIIAGLDFGRGVILEGALYKKRANKLLKWRSKYYILSQLYGALFFWTGTKDKVEGVIKKVRFETFLAVRHFPEKQNGKRFDLKVITGRTMQLLTSSPEEAKKWVETLTFVVGKLMATVRIQAAYRGHRARKELKKIQNEREKAVAQITNTGTSSSSSNDNKTVTGIVGTDVSKTKSKAKKSGKKGTKNGNEDEDQAGPAGPLAEDGVLIEAELRKRNHQVISSLVSAYRTRYFVLHRGVGALVYYESKAKRTLGVGPRCIPFLSFYSITHHLDKKGQKTRAFTLRLLSGKAFVFEARTAEDATAWVAKIESVVPRDHLAAVRVQAWVRRWRARRMVRKLRETRDAAFAVFLTTYGTPKGRTLPDLMKAATKVQTRYRGYIARKHYRDMKAKAQQAKAVPQATAGRLSKLKNLMDLKKETTEETAAATLLTKDTVLPPPPPQATTSISSTVVPLPPPPALPSTTAATVTKTVPTALPPPPVVPPIVTTSTGTLLPPPILNAKVGLSTLPPPPLPPPVIIVTKPKRKVKPSRWLLRPDTGSGQSFYANVDTGETRWDAPPGFANGTAKMVGAYFSMIDVYSGSKYYVNSVTSASVWDRPVGYESDKEVEIEDDTVGSKGGLPPPPPPPGGNSNIPIIVDVSLTADGDSYKKENNTNVASASSSAAVVGKKKAAPAELLGESVTLAKLRAGNLATNNAPTGLGSSSSATTDSSDRMRRVMNAGVNKPGLPTNAANSSGTTVSSGGDQFVIDANEANIASQAVANGSRKRTIFARRSAGHLLAIRHADVGETSAVAGIDTNWREVMDETTDRPYFYNTKTGSSCWYKPNTDDDDDDDDDEGIPTYNPVEDGTAADGNEVVTFSLWANAILEKDPVVGSKGKYPRVPLSLEDEPPAIITQSKDGLLLSCLVNAVKNGSMDLRALNLTAVPGETKLNKGAVRDDDVYYPARENIRAALASAVASVGAMVPKDTTVEAIEAGAAPAVMDALWSILKASLCRALSFTKVSSTLKGIGKLTVEGESVDELIRLSPERLVLRWVNYHLANVNCSLAGMIDSYGASFMDGVAICALVRAVCPKLAADIPNTDAKVRTMGANDAVTQALSAAFGAGIEPWFTVEGIIEGNPRLQFAFLMMLMAKCPGLADAPIGKPVAIPATLYSSALSVMPAASKPTTASSKKLTLLNTKDAQGAIERQLVSLIEKSEGTTSTTTTTTASSAASSAATESVSLARDANIVRSWLNSLNLEGVYLRTSGLSILKELKDGVILLKVLDTVEPGIVTWNRVNLRPRLKPKMIENTNYVVNVGRAMDFGLVNVTGIDIVDGNANIVVPFLWQLMRYHTLRTLSQVALSGFNVDEAEILSWANKRVVTEATKAGQPGEKIQIRSFGDTELATGIYLLYLVNSLRPCVNWKIASDGETRDQQSNNALYILSLARKLGSVSSTTWEDIVDVRPRALMLFVASLLQASVQGTNEEDHDEEEEGDDEEDDEGDEE